MELSAFNLKQVRAKMTFDIGKNLSGFFCAVILLLFFPSFAQAQAALSPLQKPNVGSSFPSINSGLKDIPPCQGAERRLRPIWIKAAKKFNLRWQVLAAITKIESDFGCNMGPSSAGAQGWTQFIPSTWKMWGMDGDGDKKASPMNAVDAVFSSARYLSVSGAPGDYKRAIFAYNHADWYVDDVLELAQTFGKLNTQEFDTLSRNSEEAENIQRELTLRSERIEKTLTAVRDLREGIQRIRIRLEESEDLLISRREDYNRARESLNQATLDYIEITQGVATSSDRPVDPENNLLEYLSDSNPADAVLVYQSAGSLLDRQSSILDVLRLRAQDSQKAAEQVNNLIQERKEMVKKFDQDLKEQTKLLQDQRQEINRAQEQSEELGQIEEDYEEEFESSTGDQGTLEDSPFNSSGVRFSIPKKETGAALGRLSWPVNGTLISPFSSNRCLEGTCRPHEGVDITASTGSPVRASAPGRVVTASEEGGYGQMVCVEHDEKVTSCYAHNSEIKVQTGDRVKRGTVLSLSGCTGRCFGPHVHYEVRINNSAVDPTPWMLE
jgi:murein DD-endopeptidase MepM/ murein hydrolase activator NlpD